MNSIANIKKTKKFYIDNFENFLNPDYIYVPLKENVKIKIKNHENVFKGSIILTKENDHYYSSISGQVIGASKVYDHNNNLINAIVIENDYKERLEKRVGTKKNINNYTKDETIKLIHDFNATKRNIKGKFLIINGIDLDPFEENYSFMIKKYPEQILECIDALCEIFKIKKCFFAIKNSDSLNVELLSNNIGTYPNISLKLLPDTYPIGKEEILINKLITDKQKHQGIMYFNVEEVLAIYEILKRNKPLCEKLITISGDLVEKPLVLNVKIGTLIKDILAYIKILNDDYIIIANGLLIGKEINENTVLTPEIRSLFITQKEEIKAKNCINCGLCSAICPVKVNPKYMKEHNNEKSKKYKYKCIACGLCSYVCPAKINLTKE